MRFAPLVTLLGFLLALLLLAVQPADAEDAPAGTSDYVEAALAQAGTNRPQLEAVLDHYRVAGDPEKLAAAEFLIANMPDKGYVITQLRTKDGTAIASDPLAYTDFSIALVELEKIEKEHGEVDFARDHLVKDLETIQADFLIRHIDEAVAAWREAPEGARVGFEAFLQYVLPYRGSEEPLDDWLPMLRRRYAPKARALREGKIDREELYQWVTKDIHQRVRFNERYYLHPTDQGYTEMGRSGMGRCEDITNMQTYAARSLALATAADYTPAWARGNNNHAWNVLLDADGTGAAKQYAHAAKVYRKTYAIQRDCLAFRLPEGREAPNRFLQSTSYIDVTDQYGPTTDVTVRLDPSVVGEERFAYLCVFNSGAWTAIHWGEIQDGAVTFDRMGRNIVYLPALHDGTKLIPAGDPIIVRTDGSMERLRGHSEGISGVLTASAPRRKSVDTHVETPVSHLKEGTTYEFYFWDGDWQLLETFTAGTEPHGFLRLPKDGLYWLIEKDFRKLERIFTIKDGRQVWW
jgi:hypothetical protein